MSSILLHSKGGRQVTSVPNLFIDNYMSEANGEYVKVYLQLLRMLGQDTTEFSLGSLADRLDYTEKDVQRSLNYWEKKNLLQLDYSSTGQLTGIEVKELEGEGAGRSASAGAGASASLSSVTSSGAGEGASASVIAVAGEPAGDAVDSPVVAGGAVSAVAGEPVVDATAEPVVEIPQEPRQYTPQELKELSEKDDIQQLMAIAPQYIKRPLNSKDSNYLLFWYDDLGFTADLIDDLMQYCVGSGHTRFSYMNQVALEWKELGITSLSQLSDHDNILSHSHRSIIKALGLTRSKLVPAELAFVEKWLGQYSFSLDIILEACNITMLNIGWGNFKYVDSILTGWHQKGVKHLEDLARLDKPSSKPATQQAQAKAAPRYQAKPNQFNAFPQREHDDAYYQQLEQQLLRK